MMNLIRRTALVAALAGAVAVGGLALPATSAAGLEQPRNAQQDRGQPERGRPAGQEGKPAEKPAAQLGELAPDFELKDLDGKTFKLSEHRGKIVVLEWFNPDCPYVKKHHEHAKTMEQTYKKYREAGVVWVAINSGAPGLQGAGKERNEKARRDFELAYPLLLDEPGKVGRLYGAKVTPHMYIINREGVLVYNGAIDNDRHPRNLGDINYVDQALGQVIRNESVTTAESTPYGCTVKYKN